jgi:ArsR family transcriptional regulator
MEKKIKFLKLLSDKTRLRIINLLNGRSVCVCGLKQILGLTQAAVSKHISRLKKFGILKEEQKSFWTYYSLDIKDKELKEIFNSIFSKFKDEKILKKDLKKLSKVSCFVKRRL